MIRSEPVNDALNSIYPAGYLAVQEFPPLRSYVDGVIVEGLGIIGGKPKIGKSWLALGLATAVAAGGVALGNPVRRVEAAPVLYLALEDGERRMKSRLERICPDGIPDNMDVAHHWPRLDAGGVDALDAAVDDNRYRFVIVDTLGRVRQPRRGRDIYGEDYAVLSELHDLARSRDGLALYVVHHNRKDDQPDDYVDALSGSTGMGGSPDLVAVLSRGRNDADALLSITGRDVVEDERALRFDNGLWTEIGSGAEYAMSKARRKAVEAVAQFHAETGEAARVTDVAQRLDTTQQNASKLLQKAAEQGHLRNVDRGAYLPNPVERVETVDNLVRHSTESTVSTTPRT